MKGIKPSGIVGVSGFICALFLSAPIARASIPPQTTPAPTFTRVDHLARIQLGDSIDTLPSVSSEKARFNLRHYLAHFHLYFFDPSLPPRCLNLQCGPFATHILAHGGFLLGGADASFLRDAEGDGHEPVLLLTDREDRVKAIYRGISRSDLRQIVREAIHDPALR